MDGDGIGGGGCVAEVCERLRLLGVTGDDVGADDETATPSRNAKAM